MSEAKEEKTCWICRRTESQVRTDLDFDPDQEVMHTMQLSAWVGLFLCEGCSDILANWAVMEKLIGQDELEDQISDSLNKRFSNFKEAGLKALVALLE